MYIYANYTVLQSNLLYYLYKTMTLKEQEIDYYTALNCHPFKYHLTLNIVVSITVDGNRT